MSKFGNASYDGPYESQITYDKTVRDNCHAQLNTNAAYRDYEEGEEVVVKTTHNGNVVEFIDSIKTKHDNVKYTSIPVDEREKLGLDPHDTVTFWIKSKDATDGDMVAIKAGSKVYHEMDDGEIRCTKFRANKPRTEDSPILTASIDEVGDGWQVCQECEQLETATNATYTELVSVVKTLIGRDTSTNSFNKAELVDIIEYLSGDTSVDELVKEVDTDD